MRVAALYDVHGNLPALEALLGDDVDLRTTDYDTAGTAAAMRATGFPRPQLADELLEPYTLERVLELVESFA